MIRKIIFIPLFIIMAVIRAIMGIVIRLSDWIFYMIGFLLLMVTVLSYYFGLESGDSLKHMVIGSGIFFLIPQAAVLVESILEFCTRTIIYKIGGR